MYKRSIEGWAKHWDFIVIDSLVLQMSLIFSHFFRFHYFFTWNNRNAYRTSAFVLLALSFVIAAIFNTMHNVLTRSLWEEFRNTIIQCGLVFAGIVIILFSAKDSDRVSRIVMYMTIFGYAVFGIIIRMVYKRILIGHKKISNNRVMLLVGDEKGVERAKASFEHHPEEGISIKSIVRVDAIGDVDLADAAEYIRNEWIDEVYIAVTSDSSLPRNLMADCSEMAVTVHQAVYLSEDQNDHILLEKIAKQPVLTTSINIPQPSQLFIKRCVDIIAGVLLSVFAVIILIIVTPIIKLLSPGPVLLDYERIGQNGRKFKMYMIRTMYMDASERPDGHKFIKGIGTFLHRWSLDQLPKGFNVLLGTMSLVGTRAPSASEWERYKYHHRARLACKPGITGLYVVCGGKELNFEETTRIDTEYITNWSYSFDLRILFTPSVMKRRYGGKITEGGDAE